MAKEKQEEQAVSDRPLFAKAKGIFHVTYAGGRMLQNGNKVRLIIEAEFDRQLAADVMALFDKDCSINFKEVASKKHRGKYGDEDGQEPIPGMNDPDPDQTEVES